MLLEYINKKLLFLFIINALNFSVSGALYCPLNKIHPGQLRYAVLNVDDKIEKALKNNDAVLNAGTNSYSLKYNSGKSSLPLTSALPVIQAQFGYVLVDGHHDILASIKLGAQEIPIKVVEDLSSLSETGFWQEAEKRGLVYLSAIDGTRQIPPASFDNLVDDPNRYFAAISARKCDKKDQDPKTTTGAEYPLWIKVGKDIPFIEFKISDVLNRESIFYFNAMGDNPPAILFTKARRALRKNSIQGLKLVTRKTHYTKIANLSSGDMPILPAVKKRKIAE